MNAFVDVVRDIDGVIVAGANVYLYGPDGQEAELFASDGVTPTDNPLVSDDKGEVSAKVADDGFYTARYYWGGRKRYVEKLLIGQSPIDQAEAFAASAEAASGPTYASTVAGLAATMNGQAFAVNTGDGIVSVYRNVAGSAVLQRSLGTTTYNDGRFTQKADLASSAVGKGAGLIGVSPTTTYPDDTVGSSLNRFFNFTNPTFELQSIGPSTPPANGVYMGAGGNSLSFFTLVSSPSDGAEFDNQRGTLLVRAVTSDDGNSEEQSLCVLTTIQTGFTTPWAASTAYATLGTNVNNGGNTYRLIQAGTSAGSGGPTGKTTNILDGTCRWMWINDSAINAKCGFYNETLVLPGAGSSWSQANNLEIKPGVLANFIVTHENDLTNNCGIDSTIGGLNKYNTYLQNNGGNVSSSVLDIGSSNTTNFSSIWGLHLTGAKLASNSVIGIDASSATGLGIGTGFGGAVNPTFTTAAIGDSSTAPKGISITGAKSVAGIEVTATTPTSFASGGTKSFAGFFDVSTAPVGLRLDGTYASDIISSPNFKVTATGNIIAKPAPTATPANNGEMTFELTSNTQLRIRVKGSDGTVRSASLTLA